MRLRGLATSFLLLVIGALSACTCSEAPLGPCEGDSRASACGAECSDTTPCPAGFHCDTRGLCDSECDPATHAGCDSSQRCTSDGWCQRGPRPGTVDGSSNVCASVELVARRQTPTVMLIVDQSGSMTESFGSSDRWTVLRDSLMAVPDGLVYSLQGQVRFGLALYTGISDDAGNAVGECPRLETVLPAIDNHGAIDTVYGPARPADDTPTGDAVDGVLNLITSVPDPTDDSIIFILATDGEPDRCEELDPQNGHAESIAAVDRAFDRGIRTYIISVGEGAVSAAHLQDVANAGVGTMGAPYWVAGDDAGLRDALRAIVGGELSCVVTLEGRIDPSMACTGIVQLNGRTIPCDDPNGWRAVDENHIELQGDACTEAQTRSGATLTATFPCDVILI